MINRRCSIGWEEYRLDCWKYVYFDAVVPGDFAAQPTSSLRMHSSWRFCWRRRVSLSSQQTTTWHIPKKTTNKIKGGHSHKKCSQKEIFNIPEPLFAKCFVSVAQPVQKRTSLYACLYWRFIVIWRRNYLNSNFKLRIRPQNIIRKKPWSHRFIKFQMLIFYSEKTPTTSSKYFYSTKEKTEFVSQFRDWKFKRE